jgi:hypothetical protein
MPEVLKKLAAFVGGKTAGAIVTTLVGLGITALVVRSCGDETTIGEIRSNLVKQGYEISAYRKLTLHPGTESYLLALRPATNALSADEIRIYDKGDDAPRLTFRPRIDHPAWPPALGLRFEVVRIRDFGNDGLREIVASYTLEAANATVRLPVAIGWEEAHQRYRLEPLLVRRGKGGKRREVGMDDWGWEQLRPWLVHRARMPVGRLFCVIAGPTCGRPLAPGAVREQLRRLAAQAGVRRRFAPHQLRHVHAVEMAREGVAINLIQRQLGHTDLGVTSTYLQGIDSDEIINAVHARRAPMMPASVGLRLQR